MGKASRTRPEYARSASVRVSGRSTFQSPKTQIHKRTTPGATHSRRRSSFASLRRLVAVELALELGGIDEVEVSVSIEIGALAFLRDTLIRTQQAVGQRGPFVQPVRAVADTGTSLAGIVGRACVIVVTGGAVLDRLGLARLGLFTTNKGLALSGRCAAITDLALAGTVVAGIVDGAVQAVVTRGPVVERPGFADVVDFVADACIAHIG